HPSHLPRTGGRGARHRPRFARAGGPACRRDREMFFWCRPRGRIVVLRKPRAHPDVFTQSCRRPRTVGVDGVRPPGSRRVHRTETAPAHQPGRRRRLGCRFGPDRGGTRRGAAGVCDASDSAGPAAGGRCRRDSGQASPLDLFMNTASLSRRDFLRQSALLAASAPLLSASVESNTPPARPPIVGFSKPFQSLRPDDMAELVAEVGWDGIECPVRRRGQIEPERVADELPHVVEALRRHGAAVHILATNITSMDNPFAERVLRTAATLGVRIIRLGYWYYGDDDSPTHRVQEIRPALRDLEAACRSLGLRAGYQNHSGHNYVGGQL